MLAGQGAIYAFDLHAGPKADTLGFPLPVDHHLG